MCRKPVGLGANRVRGGHQVILSPGSGAVRGVVEGDDAPPAGGEDHPFGQAELHLARLQVGDDHDLAADEHRRIGVVGAQAGEDLAQAAFAEVDHQLQQLVGAGHQLRRLAPGRRADRPCPRSSIEISAGGGAVRPSPSFGSLRCRSRRWLRRRLRLCLAPCFSIFAQLSLRPTVRFQIGSPVPRCPGRRRSSRRARTGRASPGFARRQIRLQSCAPSTPHDANRDSSRRGSSCSPSVPGFSTANRRS